MHRSLPKEFLEAKTIEGPKSTHWEHHLHTYFLISSSSGIHFWGQDAWPLANLAQPFYLFIYFFCHLGSQLGLFLVAFNNACLACKTRLPFLKLLLQSTAFFPAYTDLFSTNYPNTVVKAPRWQLSLQLFKTCHHICHPPLLQCHVSSKRLCSFHQQVSF